MDRDIKLFMEDILEAIARIRSYVEGMSFESFLADYKTQDAVVRNFTIIGEAAKYLDKFDDTFEWRLLSDMRNRLVHEYFGIDFEIIWSAIEDDLPVLEAQINELMAS